MLGAFLARAGGGRHNQLSEIMQQPWPAQSKKGFWDLLPGKNPQKFLFLKPNPLIDAMIAQASLKKIFQKFEHTTPPEQDTSLRGSLRTPGQHRPIMVSQGKSRGLMFIPPPGVVRNSGPHFDQALDQPVPHKILPRGQAAQAAVGEALNLPGLAPGQTWWSTPGSTISPGIRYAL